MQQLENLTSQKLYLQEHYLSYLKRTILCLPFNILIAAIPFLIVRKLVHGDFGNGITAGVVLSLCLLNRRVVIIDPEKAILAKQLHFRSGIKGTEFEEKIVDTRDVLTAEIRSTKFTSLLELRFVNGRDFKMCIKNALGKSEEIRQELYKLMSV